MYSQAGWNITPHEAIDPLVLHSWRILFNVTQGPRQCCSRGLRYGLEHAQDIRTHCKTQRRRNRPIHSCVECRRRKPRCSKTYPCANCVKYSRICVFVSRSPGNAQTIGMIMSDVALDDELSYLLLTRPIPSKTNLKISSAQQ